MNMKRKNTKQSIYLNANVTSNGNFDLCQKAKRRSLHLRMETKTVFQNYRKREENTIRAFIEERADFTQFLKYSVYGLAVFLLVALTLVQSGQIVYKYFQEPTYISSHYDRQGSAVIPSISICPELQEGQKANLKSEILTPLGLEDLDSDQWKSFYIYKADEIFDSATFRTWELLSSIDIKTVKEDPRTRSRQLVITKDTRFIGSILNEVVHPKYGRCVNINPDETLHRLGMSTLQIVMNLDFKGALRIFWHAQDQFWGATNRQMGYKLAPDESASTQLYYNDIKTIQKFSLIGDKPSCSYESYDKCVEDSIYSRLKSQANCRVPWIRNNLTSCLNTNAWQKATSIVKESIDASNDFCLQPCDFLMVTVGTTNYELTSNKSSQMTFYMPNRVMQSTERFLLSFLSMASEIGGYVGLLLGVSFFHFARFLTFVMEKRQEEKKNKVEDLKMVPKVQFVQPYTP